MKEKEEGRAEDEFIEAEEVSHKLIYDRDPIVAQNT